MSSVILRRELLRASKDERPGPAPFEGRALHGHLKVTDNKAVPRSIPQPPVDRHVELLLARADDDAIDRRDIGKIPPNCQHDVIVLDQYVVGGIEANPPHLLA